MVKKIHEKLILACLILLTSVSFSAKDFYFDAIAFKSDSVAYKGRVDCYIIIPYQSLIFNQKGSKYLSKIQLSFDIYQKGKTVDSYVVDKSIIANDYYESQGGNGSFYKLKKSFNLKDGQYQIQCRLMQNSGKELSTKSRNVNILDHNNFVRSLSALMLLSSIEDVNGKLKITPYFSDNISKIKDGFFAFLEVYTDHDNDSLSLVYQFLDTNNKVIDLGEIKNVVLNKNINQEFVYLQPKIDKLMGNFTLKIILLNGHDADPNLQSNYLAVAERSVNFTPSSFQKITNDIDLAISQLQYVASDEIINSMEKKETDAKKLDAFIEFWKDLDPTPYTERNEAFEDYFKRIDLASKRFNSYSSGWRSDMANVFVVLGEPDQITNLNQSMTNRVTRLVWYYNNGFEFIFEDRTGFGDFRLVRPMSFNMNYEYGRN